MRYYVLWGEVQQRMEQWARRHNSLLTFRQAMELLWKEGAARQAECLPSVDFQQWDLLDLEEFYALTELMPVDLTAFAEEESPGLDAVIPRGRVLPTGIAPYSSVERQAHRGFGIFYVLGGEGGISTLRETAVYPAGTLVIMTPELVCGIFAQPGSHVISFDGWFDTLDRAVRRLLPRDGPVSRFFYSRLAPDARGYLTMTLPPDRSIRSLLQRIFQEGYSGQPYSDEICSSSLELLILYALRQCASAPPERAGRGQGFPALAVLSYIQANYRTASLGDVAAAFHYEPGYLSRQIKASAGRTYTDIVRGLRVEEAKRLLKSGGLSMERVAELSGYHSEVHFFREFRAAAGMTPGEYRRQQDTAASG